MAKDIMTHKYLAVWIVSKPISNCNQHLPVIQTSIHQSFKQHGKQGQPQNNFACSGKGLLVNFEAGTHENDSQATCPELAAPRCWQIVHWICTDTNNLMTSVTHVMLSFASNLLAVFNMSVS